MATANSYNIRILTHNLSLIILKVSQGNHSSTIDNYYMKVVALFVEWLAAEQDDQKNMTTLHQMVINGIQQFGRTNSLSPTIVK